MRTRVLRLFVMLVAAISPAASQPINPTTSAGTSTFSELRLQPDSFPAAGGSMNLTVTIADTVGLQSARVRLRYPDGQEDSFDLKRDEGAASRSVWIGTLTLNRNWAEGDRLVSLALLTRNTAGKYSRSNDIPIRQGALPPDRPRIGILQVPRLYTEGRLNGIVFNGRTEDYAAVPINWSSFGGITGIPCLGPRVTGLDQLGRFEPTVPVERFAHLVTAYLVPKNADVPCFSYGPVTPIENVADGMDAVSREFFLPARLVSLRGEDWQVGERWVSLSTGLPTSSGSADFVTADNQGLRFKLSPCRAPGRTDQDPLEWCSPEARLLRKTGYGTYTATISGNLAKLGADVFAGFHLKVRNSFFDRRIEVRFTQDLLRPDGNHFQFGVQPFARAPAETQKRFPLPPDVTVATVRFRWEPNRVIYWIWRGEAPEPTAQTQLATWTFDRTSSSADVPIPGDSMLHFELGLNTLRPSPASLTAPGSEELILNSFRYEPLKPGLTSVGVTNGASYTAGAVSPGMVTSIFGYALGGDTASTLRLENGRVASELSGTRVLFDNVPAPLIFTQWGQVSAIVPFSVSGRATTRLEVEHNGVRSDPVTLPVLPSLPGIFSLYATGVGQGAILHSDYTVNGPGNAAARGSFVTLYVTGVGVLSPAVADGAVVTPQDLPRIALPVRVTIGKVAAEVVYAGAAPGLVAGVAQLNVRIPDNAPTGPDIPVLVLVGNRPSQGTVTIAVN